MDLNSASSGTMRPLLLFITLLGVIYLITSLPTLNHIQPLWLALGNLDPIAVFEHHQYWRLLTGNLLHANLGHLLSNGFSLCIFGALLSQRLSAQAFWCLILFSMLGADIGSFMGSVPHSIGASGVAYGFQTAYVGMVCKTLLVYPVQPRRKTLRSLAGYLILMVCLALYSPQEINVYGHLGGCVVGLIFAIFYPVPLNRSTDHAILKETPIFAETDHTRS